MVSNVDRQSLLTTDVRIIAENDSHAVIAVRLEKHWISRNLHVLVALGALTSPRNAMPPAAKKSRNK